MNIANTGAFQTVHIYSSRLEGINNSSTQVRQSTNCATSWHAIGIENFCPEVRFNTIIQDTLKDAFASIYVAYPIASPFQVINTQNWDSLFTIPAVNTLGSGNNIGYNAITNKMTVYTEGYYRVSYTITSSPVHEDQKWIKYGVKINGSANANHGSVCFEKKMKGRYSTKSCNFMVYLNVSDNFRFFIEFQVANETLNISNFSMNMERLRHNKT